MNTKTTYQEAVAKAEQLIQRAAEHPHGEEVHKRAVYFLEVFRSSQVSEFFQPDAEKFVTALEDLEQELT